MKISIIFLLLAAMLVAVSALPKRDPPRLPRPTGGNPNFGGYGSFNPRGRRSPDGGKIIVDQPIHGKATVKGSYDKTIYDGKYGTVRLYGNARQSQDERMQANGGVHYEFQFGDDKDSEDTRMREIEKYRKELQLH